MVESASARAQRLLDLVPFLHSHPGTTVGEVAGHFGISKSDVIKDLNLLFLCGLPGYTHLELIDISFDDEVITVIDAQNLKSPRRLTELEAIALRIALQALSEILPGSHGSQRKISALLEKLAGMHSNSLPSNSIAIEIPTTKVIFATLERALDEGKQVEITYLNRAKDERTTRVVSPKSISVEGDRPLLYAWCHLNNGMRTFNVDQIEEAKILQDTAILGTSEDREDSRVAKVVLKVPPQEIRNKHVVRLLGTKPALSDSQFTFFDDEWLIRFALSSASEIVVEKPEAFHSVIHERAQRALSLYSEF